MGCEVGTDLNVYKWGIVDDATFYKPLAFTDIDKNPIDISAYTLKGELRDAIDSDTVLYTFDSSVITSIDMTNANVGRIVLIIPKSTVSTFTFKKAFMTFTWIDLIPRTRAVFNSEFYFKESTTE